MSNEELILDDRPMPPLNGSRFCFKCPDRAYRYVDGKWLCEGHYEEYNREKNKKRFERLQEKDQT